MGNCQENAVILSFNISYAGSVKGNLKLISEYFKWSEYAFGSKMVEESGPMFGLGIEVKKSFPNSLNLNFGFKFLFGSVDYDGRTWGGWQVSSTTNDPGKKISMLFEAGIRFERLSLGLFYENMKFSESSPVPVFNFFLFQPESEADIWGIILRIYF